MSSDWHEKHRKAKREQDRKDIRSSLMVVATVLFVICLAGGSFAFFSNLKHID